jgi:hypothetical protein
MNLIEEVKKKKEFKELPDSLIQKVLSLKEVKGSDEEKVKQARAILRKYFSVFMSNKIVSGKLSAEEMLAKHISSKERDYPELYHRIVKDEDVVFDFGAGVNGFSYKYIGKKYIAFEATKRFVDLMNKYFQENEFNAGAIWADLFDIECLLKIIKGENGKKSAWMLNIIDALELEPNFSKVFISEISKLVDRVVLSWPTQSLQKKRKFSANRNWIFSFIQQNYKILDNFEMNGEKFVCFCKPT